MSKNKHAKLSASGSARWSLCPGSVVLEEGFSDSSSEYAEEGTRAHAVAERDLKFTLTGELDVLDFDPSEDMQDEVAKYTTYVKTLGGKLFVEQRLSIEHITFEKEACGTSDAVVITDDYELVVIDLKFGMGEKIDAENNTQLLMYLSAAYEEFSFAYDIRSVRAVIHQPRLNHVSEWPLTLEELKHGIGKLQVAAGIVAGAEDYAKNYNAVSTDYLHPSEKACRWCKAKATCPAISVYVVNTIGADFDDIDAELVNHPGDGLDSALLSEKMGAVGLIEDWCKAIRAEVERRLFQGEDVEGYKLVQGKKGNRAWTDANQVETTLKAMRLKLEEMYNLKLISPSDAEKLAKKNVIGPKQWPKLQNLIGQSEGKPSVAPAGDKRPALQIGANAEDFDNLDDGADLC